MQFKVFGCKVNKYYTDNWLNSEYLSDKTGIFVASCVVTDKAKRKWIKFVKQAVRELRNPPPSVPPQNGEGGFAEPKIFISGCGAFKKGKAQEDFFDIYPELAEFQDKIVVLGEKPEELEREIDGETKKEKKNQSPLEREMSRNTLKGTSETEGLWIKNKIKKLPQIYTKKFLLIQWWCNSFCTFCLTVQKRGRHYFRDKDDIVQEILEFEKNGGKEVVLTGVNLSAWGLQDTNDTSVSRFAELLEYILKNTSIPRVRISSMGPEFIDEKCLEVFKETRIYPHFHYSVQSGSSKVLKAMRRHYDGKYMRDLLEKTKNLKREDGVEVSVGADLIVGFPGETQKDFEDTYNLVKDGLITKVHAFPFSAHTFGESVPAGRFPDQVSDTEKKERMWKLEAIADQVREDFIERNIGKTFKVLIEVVKWSSLCPDGHLPPSRETQTSPSPSLVRRGNNQEIKWKGWTENYIEADEKTFEIIEWKIEKNTIVIGKLK